MNWYNGWNEFIGHYSFDNIYIDILFVISMQGEQIETYTKLYLGTSTISINCQIDGSTS